MTGHREHTTAYFSPAGAAPAGPGITVGAAVTNRKKVFPNTTKP